MGKYEATRGDRVTSPGPHGGSQSKHGDAENNASFEVLTDKGKGKEIMSSIDRMQSSGRALLGSALGDLCTSGVQPGQKGTGSSGTSSSYMAHQSIYESQGQVCGELTASSNQKFKLANDVKRTDADFDAFASGSGSNEAISVKLLVAESPNATKSLQQSDMDGIDVVRLLSQPERGEDPPLPDNDDLTPLETARLREALFGPGSSWPFWDQLLNFNADLTRCEGHMGTSNPGEARSMWLQQWNDVLLSYTDEVWGDLGPLAKDAKQEVAKLKKDEANDTPHIKALERLRLVLAHVRGY